jgi:eukaryotic-like serine/threonine-protein kinase
VAIATSMRLGPYQIVAPLGAGGMGEVYKARDTRLDRIVAIKILPSADPELRARFQREAKAIAALTHPHICTLHDIGRQDGTDYLVMEYIEGETLANRLRRGPLTIKDAFRFAIEIADGLGKAHRAGVVHRDLKPSNVMVTAEGQTKVMDFGVAKRIVGTDADPASLATMTVTTTGEVAGTLIYMSPEQLRGLPVDGRSDIFSFGLLLHEMATGTHPFLKSSSISTIDAILNAPGPTPDRYANAPPLLAHVVNRCLAKDRDQRYQSFREVGIELKALAANAPSSSRRPLAQLKRQSSWLPAAAVVVALTGATLSVRYWPTSLPLSQRVLAFKERDWILVSDFDNLTGDKVFDRSLRTALEVGISQSQFVNVFPASRLDDTLKRMQRPAVDQVNDVLASEVAVREGIKAVLACSIAQVGNVYSLTARLIDPQSRVAVLTESIQAKGKDQVLPALDSLATRVRRNLGESLAAVSQQSVPLPKATTSSLEALKMYADSLILASHDSSNQTVDDLLRQAIVLDPNFALAHAELGRRYYLKSERSVRIQGEEHFVKALNLLDRLSTRERLWIRALAEDSRGYREAAVDAYKSYLAQYPDDARGWYRVGWTPLCQ